MSAETEFEVRLDGLPWRKVNAITHSDAADREATRIASASGSMWRVGQTADFEVASYWCGKRVTKKVRVYLAATTIDESEFEIGGDA